MRKNLSDPLPEIIFGSSDTALSKAIGRAVKSGKLRKITSRIYTSNLHDAPEKIFSRHRYHILGNLFPNAVLSYRSALEGGPAKDGSLFLNYKYTKKIKLPGLIVYLIKGAGPMEGDTAFMNKLYLASRARAFLENMQISRRRTSVPKTLSKIEIEDRLESLCQIHGPEELNTLRDQAKKLAPKLALANEFKKLNYLISSILGSHDVNILHSKKAKARAMGEPYDQYRLDLFANLIAVLKTQPLAKRKNTATTKQALQNLAFFEAYFSNFIEGTEFLIEEAEDIIFHHKIISNRIEDTHDILGTYTLVSNDKEMRQTPRSPEQLIQLLQNRHAVMMENRPTIAPGRFKEKNNRAGNTVFVKPELVIGTLKQSFELYLALQPGIERAIFMMFVIAEIHPFIDGNGRIARVMMNAELVSTNEMRIIIPTVYREDYLLTLRSLSRTQNATPYIRMLDYAQKFTVYIDFSHYDHALHMLKKVNAFLEPSEGRLDLSNIE